MDKGLIDACIRSAGEPQLERCLESVKNQTVPFANVFHVEVVPESRALRALLDLVKSEWMMLIDGDMILHPKAVEIAQNYIQNEKDPAVVEYQFALYDTFLKRVINSCRVSKTETIRNVRIKDWLGNDLSIVRQMEAQGMKIVRFWKNGAIAIGTHFDKPSDFQIFYRHYHAGVARTKGTMEALTNLYLQTKTPEYDLALKALEYGLNKPYKSYPGSRDVNHDRTEFEKFKALSC